MSGAKPGYDPDWQAKYGDLIATPEAAIRRLKPGQRLFIGSGCAQPRTLTAALAEQWQRLPDTELVHLHTFGEAPYARAEPAKSFRINTFFIADNVRELIQQGRGDYTPIFLSDIPRLFSSGRMPLDAALIQVSPPDVRGLCSLGISVDVVKSAAANASLVIAQVNPRMPRTLGDSFINVNDMDVLVPIDEALYEVERPTPTAVTRKIGEYVAALIEDGATLELGIGRIPQAVPEHLLGRQDLGIHTELVTDAIIDLMAAGCVSGARKTLDRGKVVASMCIGTRRLYDYVDDNPAFSFRPTEYVNDPDVISKQQAMVAINVALEVDLTGQVCADSLGSTFYSGIGGQADFIRGAARAPDGKAIIALPATAEDGAVSRIVTCLSRGAGVVTTRGDVHYVVTEFGAAFLHGKSVQERALALISIAHPDFRAQLLHEAIEANYIRRELADVEGRIIVGPQELRAKHLLRDGTQISFRPVHPTDEPRMRELFYRVSQATLFYRFMTTMRTVPHKQIQDVVYIDHRSQIAIVGTLPEAYGEEIIAVAAYYLDLRTNRAEVAFVVSDEWQGRGIGTFMMNHLATIAKRNGVRGFTADTVADNLAMQAVFFDSGLKVSSHRDGNVCSFVMDFA